MSYIAFIEVGVFLMLAGLCNAVMDISSENKFKNKWWNKNSWRNKWLLNEFGEPVVLHDSKQNPYRVEKFWGSSRWFVLVTDGWHLSQFFCWRFMQAAVLSGLQLNWWQFVVGMICCGVLFSVPFQILYRKLK